MYRYDAEGNGSNRVNHDLELDDRIYSRISRGFLDYFLIKNRVGRGIKV